MKKTNKIMSTNIDDQLLYAAKIGDILTIKTLIHKHTIDINKYYNGYTILMIAAIYKQLQTVKELVKLGANIHLKNELDEPLLIQLEDPDLELVEFLVDSGIDINDRSEQEETALMLSTKLEYTKLLIKLGAQVNACDIFGNTAVFNAYDCEKYDIVLYLFEHGANINETYYPGDTITMMAVRDGNIDLVKQLLNFKPDLTIRNIEDDTALTLTYVHQHVEIMYCLVDAGADKNELGRYGYIINMLNENNLL